MTRYEVICLEVMKVVKKNPGIYGSKIPLASRKINIKSVFPHLRSLIEEGRLSLLKEEGKIKRYIVAEKPGLCISSEMLKVKLV